VMATFYTFMKASFRWSPQIFSVFSGGNLRSMDQMMTSSYVVPLGGIIYGCVRQSSETSGWSLGGAVLFLAHRQRRVLAVWRSGIFTAFAWCLTHAGRRRRLAQWWRHRQDWQKLCRS
jgi:hypothetical protein